MSDVKKVISKDIEKMIPLLVKVIQRRIKEGLSSISYKEKYFDEVFMRDDQETQSCTKFYQFYVCPAIEECADILKIPLIRDEADGHDWLYRYKGVDYLLEQKIKTILQRGRSFKNNIKDNKLICDSWTGNKSAVASGSKTDLHILWTFLIDFSNITGLFGAVLSLKENNSAWKTNKGKKGSYANLKIRNNGKGYEVFWGKPITSGASNRKIIITRCQLADFNRGLIVEG